MRQDVSFIFRAIHHALRRRVCVYPCVSTCLSVSLSFLQSPSGQQWVGRTVYLRTIIFSLRQKSCKLLSQSDICTRSSFWRGDYSLLPTWIRVLCPASSALIPSLLMWPPGLGPSWCHFLRGRLSWAHSSILYTKENVTCTSMTPGKPGRFVGAWLLCQWWIKILLHPLLQAAFEYTM